MKTSRENMAGALMSLGYEVSRQWQFKLRDEQTPSAKINMDGSVHDFGSGFHGDLIDILQEYRNMDFKSAKQEAEKLLGQEIKFDFTKFEKTTDKINTKPLPDSFMVPHRIDAKNNRQAYLHELKELFLGKYDNEEYVAAKWENILKVAEKYDIQFHKDSNRLIMPIRNDKGQIMTFWKYKKRGQDFIRENGKVIKHRKVLYTKNRQRPPFAIQDIREFAKTPEIPILLTEGEKDAMVANANGQRAVCIGGAGASKNLGEYLHLFKGLKVIIAGDYDKAGVAFNVNLLEQLKPIAKSVTILKWEQKAKEDGFKLHPKFDLADYFAWKNNVAGKKTVKVLVRQIIEKVVEVELDKDEAIDNDKVIDLANKITNSRIKYSIKEYK